MQLTYDEGKELYLADNQPEAPRFEVIEGAFGWLNAQGKGHALYHWFVVAGLTESKKIVFLEESHGPLHFVGMDAIDAKDRLLISRIHADFEQRQICNDLMSENYDGLTHYESRGRDALKRLQYLHEPKHWKNFRNRSTTAALVPLVTEEKINIQAGYDRLAHEIERKNTSFRRRVYILPTLTKLPIDEALRHPGVMAMIWVHNALLRGQKTAKPVVGSTSAYGNLKRR